MTPKHNPRSRATAPPRAQIPPYGSVKAWTSPHQVLSRSGSSVGLEVGASERTLVTTTVSSATSSSVAAWSTVPWCVMLSSALEAARAVVKGDVPLDSSYALLSCAESVADTSAAEVAPADRICIWYSTSRSPPLDCKSSRRPRRVAEETATAVTFTSLGLWTRSMTSEVACSKSRCCRLSKWAAEGRPLITVLAVAITSSPTHAVVGRCEGAGVGWNDGSFVGSGVGGSEGVAVGLKDGSLVGSGVGNGELGRCVGMAVGCGVGQ
mmetsp:Transcript_19284/g.43736  ORF Transcript_19284/g.43736 Transcript_19284/m.43736 type:complete len:266 (-) Transcript_19284:2343-3140(-)